MTGQLEIMSPVTLGQKCMFVFYKPRYYVTILGEKEDNGKIASLIYKISLWPLSYEKIM